MTYLPFIDATFRPAGIRHSRSRDRRKGPDASDAAAGLNALAADEDPETESRSVRAALLERVEELFHLAWWKAPALVLDLDLDSWCRRHSRGARRVRPRV
jgi:hypothetical protein